MWFWQRREIFIADSMQEFNRVRDILEQSRIPYDYRLRNRTPISVSRSPELGRWGTDPKSDTIYYIYVKKQDFDAAQDALNKK